MKKRCLALVLAGMMSLSLVACGNAEDAQQNPTEEAITDVSAEAATEEVVSIANPWRDCTEDEAMEFVVNGFSAPESAVNEKWSVMEAAPSELPGTMVQLQFEIGNTNFVAREQAQAGAELVDISGMYYDWTVEDEGTLANWAGGAMPFKSYRFVGADEYVDLILWFDIETGYAYSVSAQAPDLEGFDLQAIVEQMYDPAKQESALMPDDEVVDEYSNASLKEIAENAAPSIDISGCDTFTQVVDQKLTSGMGYANATVNDTDVLLVATGTFGDLEGNANAIDSAVFEYKDGAVYELGKVMSGGTAYPITVKDGYLYSASNHWVCKYAIADDKLMIMEKASVVYDENGTGTYHYESDDGGDYGNFDSAEAEKIFNQLVDEMMNGEVVEYSVVQ